MTVIAMKDAKSVSEKLDTALLRELSRRSMFPWVSDALLDWAIIAATMAAVVFWPNAVTALGAILVIGNRQHALAILGHDGTHYTLSHNADLNDFLTNLLCWWPLGLTVSGYRALHYAHHKHTGTAHDPELGHKRMRAPQWDLPNRPATVLRYALQDLVGSSLADYAIIVRFSKPGRRRESTGLAMFHILAASLLIACGGLQIVLLWYLCLPTSFMMFFRLRLWLEHQGSADTQRIALTNLQGAILAPHAAWHHWEHHRYPTIPYHRLAEARAGLDGPAILSLKDLVAAFGGSVPIPSGAALAPLPQAEMDRAA